MTVLKKYFQIIKVNLKHNFLPHLLLSLLVLIITPILFGIGNLNSAAAWAPLEMFVSFIGIILLVPVFSPELDPEIADVVNSKYTSMSVVYLLRAVYSIAAIAMSVFLFCSVMKLSGSAVSMLHIGSTIANAVFLGSLGAIGIAVSRNIAIGYMIPLIYYAINYSGAEHLGKFFLFSGMSGSYHEKVWLFVSGIIIIFISVPVNAALKKWD